MAVTYTWKKYRCVEGYAPTGKYTSTYMGDETIQGNSYTYATRLGSSYSFDKSTGKYTLGGVASGPVSWLEQGNGPYFIDINGRSTTGSDMYKYISGTLKTTGYTSSSTFTIEAELYRALGESVKEYTQGSYISDVTSTNSSAYPNNGRHSDGYWYVYQGSDNVAPTTPGKPTLSSSEIKGGDTIAISWSASTDANSNLSGYQLQVQLDGGSWTQIYTGSSRSYNYTVPSGTETIAFQVRAYDSSNAYSSYATSTTYAVTNTLDVIYGYANIGGINKQLTGEGYATIGGILRPLVKYLICHNSVWKSMLTGTEVVSTLPDDYAQLEYIESTGTQYIDTGFGSTAGWKSELGWKFTKEPSSEQDIIAAVYQSGSTYWREYVIAKNNQWALGHYSNSAYSGSVKANVKYDIEASTVSGNGYLNINGSQIFKYTTTFNAHTAHNVYVFAMNYKSAEGFATGRLYYLRLYDHNGTLIRNFVPCMNPDGIVGLYDTVGGTFYPNNGTGEFVAGEPVASTVHPVPKNFIQTEYIESTGTQWINTGVSGSSNVGFEIDFLTSNVVGPSNMDYGTIFGAFTSESTRINLGTWNSSQVTTGGEMCWGSNTYNPYITSKTRMQVSILGTTLTTPNGVQTTSSGTFTSGATIGLFARNNNGTADQFSKTKLYSFKLYENSVLVRDFIPCINASGDVGLWDKVNGKFYGNSGTGSFASSGAKVSGYTDITPVMTSNTTPSGYVASASSSESTNRVAWTVFNGINATQQASGYWHSQANMPQWIMLQFPEAVRVDMFTIKNCIALGSTSLGTINYYGITAFQLQGSNNGSTFTTLGDYISTGDLGATNQYIVNSPNSYKYYRINVTSTGFKYSNIDYAVIDQIRFYQSNS